MFTECLILSPHVFTDIDGAPIYQEWCKTCSKLSGCLLERSNVSDEEFIQQILMVFEVLRKYITKKFLIKSLMLSLQEHNLDEDLVKMGLGLGMYMEKLKPFSNSNMTLLDAWFYSIVFSIFEGEYPNIKTLSNPNKTPRQALKNCAFNKTDENCLLVENISKEIGMKNNEMWQNLYPDLFDDLIPLCSYATNDEKLYKCTAFKKSKTKLQQGHCFTFNESNFTPELGHTQGLNFVVNFDYPGTNFELGQPSTIILHEPGMVPDITNIKGKNFEVFPGNHVRLRISTTILDSTEHFDDMSFISRHCHTNVEYGEVNCLVEKMVQRGINLNNHFNLVTL